MATEYRGDSYDVEIVQIGAPHGVLDLADTVRDFQGVISDEIEPGANNILLYEDTGAFTGEEAEKMSEDVARRKSVADAGMAIVSREEGASVFALQREVDKKVLHTLLCSPLDEREHHLLAMLFFDWLLERKKGLARLEFVPESCSSEDMKRELFGHAVTSTRSRPLYGRPLEDLVAESRYHVRNLSENVALRDVEIGQYLERLLLERVSEGTRTKVLITIGSRHSGIEAAMTDEFLEKITYRERINELSVAGEYLEDAFLGHDISKERAAREIAFGMIANQIKRIFLRKYRASLIKEPAKNEDDDTVIDFYRQLIMTMPASAVYYFLQSMAGIDCGVSIASSDCVLPQPLSEDFDSLYAKLSDRVEQWGVVDLSDSEMGVYLNRRLVLNFLFVAFDVPNNAMIRQLFRDLVNSFEPDFIAELKLEIEMFLESGGLMPLLNFGRLLERILCDPKFQVLFQALVENRRVVNVGGRAHLNFRLDDL